MGSLSILPADVLGRYPENAAALAGEQDQQALAGGIGADAGADTLRLQVAIVDRVADPAGHPLVLLPVRVDEVEIPLDAAEAPRHQAARPARIATGQLGEH